MSGTSTSSSSTGASTLISVVPEGTHVKKGDVLAELDVSTYEEMLRQQTIVVEQAKASYIQAELNHEIAGIALREYMEGMVEETIQDMKANIAFAESALNQAGERLEWTKKMNSKGYASIAQIQTDKQTVMTSEIAVQRLRASYDLFERFTLPKTKMTLQADITTTQTTLDSEKVKLNRQVERLELLKKQVARCTIRAPTTAWSSTTSRPIRGRTRSGSRSKRASRCDRSRSSSTCPTSPRWRSRSSSTRRSSSG